MRKIAQVTLIGAASLLTALSFSAIAPAETNRQLIENRAVAQSLMNGTFVAAEAPTAGTVRVMNENGQRYLVFDSTFTTSSQGPDLHVLLDTTTTPPQTYGAGEATRYINLGKLQKFQGEQRYPIPSSVNLSSFKSVVIWCRMANATFGYAPLKASGSAAVR